ncbi:SRPBCC family protein [Tahibacter sp.]|uniref:SRPBCC family protein n=1 Tax=Tahibacter sp. TaxID=2056211 RepID=UPI0028C3A58D|nr:SRPBCC family protein [Tahibacter sp.]
MSAPDEWPHANEHAVAHAQFTIERVYAAMPVQVFAAWADPAAKSRWFVAGKGWDLAEYEHDFRVGGREHGSFQRKAGEPVYRNEVRYLDILAPHRIVLAYSMARDAVRISASLLSVQFIAEGGGTRLRLTEQGAFLDRHDSSASREQGWEDLLTALGKELGHAS